MLDKLDEEVGQNDICDGCTEDKIIIFVSKVKQYDGTERTTSLCKQCFRKGCFCALCFKKTTYSSYENHLLKKHSNYQMAKQLLNEKVASDLY